MLLVGQNNEFFETFLELFVEAHHLKILLRVGQVFLPFNPALKLLEDARTFEKRLFTPWGRRDVIHDA